MDLEECVMSEKDLAELCLTVERDNPDLYDVYLETHSIPLTLSSLNIPKKYKISNYCAELVVDLIFEAKGLEQEVSEPIEERTTSKGVKIPAEDFMCYASAQSSDFRTSKGGVAYGKIKKLINGWYHSNNKVRTAEDIKDMIFSFEKNLPNPKPKEIRCGIFRVELGAYKK